MAGARDTITLVANLLVILAAVVILTRPGGGLRSFFSERTEEASLRKGASGRWADLTARGGAIASSPDASDTIVVFTDYQCPFCRASEPAVERFVSGPEGQVLILYRHLPLADIHPFATSAAKASICAEEQGAFPRMHRVLFDHTEWHDSVSWVALAARSGVSDLGRFEDCLDDAGTARRLDQDMKLAAELGITGTPTWFGEGRVHLGWVDEGALLRLVTP